jgi:hypothetical protein
MLIHSNINDIIDFYRACVGSSIIIENKYSHIVFLYVFFIYFEKLSFGHQPLYVKIVKSLKKAFDMYNPW